MVGIALPCCTELSLGSASGDQFANTPNISYPSLLQITTKLLLVKPNIYIYKYILQVTTLGKQVYIYITRVKQIYVYYKLLQNSS